MVGTMDMRNINNFKPALLSILVGILIASFVQSCSTPGKAKMLNILPTASLYGSRSIVDNTNITFDSPVLLNSNIKAKVRDTSMVPPVKSPYPLPEDTLNYGQLILYNQQISLKLQQDILNLLILKERENFTLKQANTNLSKKSEITQGEKEDAVSMKMIWETGNRVLLICGAVMLLLMVNVYMLVRIYNKKCHHAQIN